MRKRVIKSFYKRENQVNRETSLREETDFLVMQGAHWNTNESVSTVTEEVVMGINSKGRYRSA